MKEIIIDIAPEAGPEQVKIEAVGFKGSACEKATAAYEAALGKVKDRNRKKEYHAKEQVKVRG